MEAKKLILFLFVTTIFISATNSSAKARFNNSALVFQQMNFAIIEIDENDSLYFNDKPIQLEDISVKVNEVKERLKKKGFEMNSLTIKTYKTSSEETVNLIKKEVKKTDVKFIDVQVRELVSSKKVTDSMLVKYNKLISNWKNQSPENRVFTKEDVDFVRKVSKNMDFDQMIKAQKLPGFIPKIEELDSLN